MKKTFWSICNKQGKLISRGVKTIEVCDTKKEVMKLVNWLNKQNKIFAWCNERVYPAKCHIEWKIIKVVEKP